MNEDERKVWKFKDLERHDKFLSLWKDADPGIAEVDTYKYHNNYWFDILDTRDLKFLVGDPTCRFESGQALSR